MYNKILQRAQIKSIGHRVLRNTDTGVIGGKVTMNSPKSLNISKLTLF